MKRLLSLGVVSIHKVDRTGLFVDTRDVNEILYRPTRQEF
jgi:hypothetical protein